MLPQLSIHQGLWWNEYTRKINDAFDLNVGVESTISWHLLSSHSHSLQQQEKTIRKLTNIEEKK